MMSEMVANLVLYNYTILKAPPFFIDYQNTKSIENENKTGVFSNSGRSFYAILASWCATVSYSRGTNTIQRCIFSFGFFNLLLEQRAISDGINTFMDDEITQGVLWLIFVILQSFFYYSLYRFFGAMRQRRLTND